MRKTIIVNNVTISEKQALKEAREYYKQTGLEVEVSDILCDPILWISNKGEFYYGNN